MATSGKGRTSTKNTKTTDRTSTSQPEVTDLTVDSTDSEDSFVSPFAVKGADKKTWANFMLQLEEYMPTIPDTVTASYMNTAGIEATDPRIVRVISLAAQKFVADIANNSLQHCKMRGAGQTKKAVKDKRYTLSMEDLAPALSEYGISVKKPYYFV